MLLLGFGLGYLISRYKVPLIPQLEPVPNLDLDILPGSLSLSSLSASHLYKEDPYFLPPLDGERYPTVPSYNVLSKDSEVLSTAHKLIPQSPITPLFIPFTRNHHMLRQAVLSYIAAGWPRSQIFVIDNSGTMDANLRGYLSDTNPFFLDYNIYRRGYGVNIIRTPTLFSFAQLQNFMLSTAMNNGWSHYFWSHQDVAVLSDESKVPFKSLYENTLSSLISLYPTMNSTDARKEGKQWGIVWYGFDWLALVNVAAATDREMGVGAWDTFIPYYHSDCDYYERMRLSGYSILERRVGWIFDLAEHVKDLEYYFFGVGGSASLDGAEKGRIGNGDGKPGSMRYKMLKRKLRVLMGAKNTGERNTWQYELRGGKGEPWTYDPDGFQTAWWGMADAGRAVFSKKWGTLACKPSTAGKGLSRIWNEAEDGYYGQNQGYEDEDEDNFEEHYHEEVELQDPEPEDLDSLGHKEMNEAGDSLKVEVPLDYLETQYDGGEDTTLTETGDSADDSSEDDSEDGFEDGPEDDAVLATTSASLTNLGTRASVQSTAQAVRSSAEKTKPAAETVKPAAEKPKPTAEPVKPTSQAVNPTPKAAKPTPVISKSGPKTAKSPPSKESSKKGK
ncbi:hypothetical protein TWF281_007508 [Arthrobotrys megalospora]